MSQKIATGYRKISLTLKNLFSPCSGFLGFFLMFSTMKLKSLLAPGQCAAWIFFAKVRGRGRVGNPSQELPCPLFSEPVCFSLVFRDSSLVTDPESHPSLVGVTISKGFCLILGFPCGSDAKESCQQKQVWSLGQEDPLEEDMAAHSSILAWRIPMDREAWRSTVHGVAKSQTRLTQLSRHARMIDLQLV